MTLQEFYEQIGGNFEIASERLLNEKTAYKILRKFQNNSEFPMLQRAMKEGNQHDAFRAAHTLKGAALTLELGVLAKSAAALTEALRDNETPDAQALYETVCADYKVVAEALQKLLG